MSGKTSSTNKEAFRAQVVRPHTILTPLQLVVRRERVLLKHNCCACQHGSFI